MSAAQSDEEPVFTPYQPVELIRHSRVTNYLAKEYPSVAAVYLGPWPRPSSCADYPARPVLRLVDDAYESQIKDAETTAWMKIMLAAVFIERACEQMLSGDTVDVWEAIERVEEVRAMLYCAAALSSQVSPEGIVRLPKELND